MSSRLPIRLLAATTPGPEPSAGGRSRAASPCYPWHIARGPMRLPVVLFENMDRQSILNLETVSLALSLCVPLLWQELLLS